MEFYDTNDLKNEEIQLLLDCTYQGDPARNWVPAYYFNICTPDGSKVGYCDLRIGHNKGLYFGGNIGYTVAPACRGHQYAAKACSLLFDLARKHKMEYLIITCHPDNLASRRTCEILGGELLEIAELPADHDLRREDGHTCECIYLFDL